MSDETGTPSWFRHAATGVLMFCGWFTVRAVHGDPVPDRVWEYWLPVTLTILAGAGGPRLVSYLAPIAVAAVQRVRSMVTSSSSTPARTVTTTVEDAGAQVQVVEDDDPVPPGAVKLE